MRGIYFFFSGIVPEREYAKFYETMILKGKWTMRDRKTVKGEVLERLEEKKRKISVMEEDRD